MIITPEQYASLEKRIIAAVDASAQELIAISRDIHAHPELMWKEHYAVKILTQKLMTEGFEVCLLYTSPSPRDRTRSRMPSSA